MQQMEFQQQWEHIVHLLYDVANDIFCHSSTFEVTEEQKEDTSHHNNISQGKTSACTLVMDTKKQECTIY